MKTVLFLCTGNSCRSIMAEALLNHYGQGRFRALSAGSFPTGNVHPLSLATLEERGISGHFTSKSWNAFKDEAVDIVITVCDAAAGESCPAFAGNPIRAHWGVPDPAKFEGSEEEIREEFSRIADILERRVMMLVHLPIEEMDTAKIQHKLDLMGTI